MKLKIRSMAQLAIALCLLGGCDAQKAPVEKGREPVSQPFNALARAKDSLKQSEDTQKAALEEAA